MEVTLEDYDPYLAEYAARLEAGEPGSIDRANAALERADQAASILAEDHPGVADAALAEVARFARLTAAAEAAEADALASKLADAAEVAALAVDAFDSARFDGLSRAQPLDSERERARRVGRRS